MGKAHHLFHLQQENFQPGSNNEKKGLNVMTKLLLLRDMTLMASFHSTTRQLMRGRTCQHIMKMLYALLHHQRICHHQFPPQLI